MLKKTVLQKFDKELFKNSVIYNVKTLYRKTLEEATQQQIFQAVAYAIKDVIVDNWMNTQKEYAKQAWADWLPASWIPWQPWGIPLMAAASVTVTACSSRRSVTDTR